MRVAVLIDSAGQLGTASSSRRFKEDIEDLGEMSRRLMALRPVTFRYKKPYADGTKPIQYGLIAEEVAETFPELAAYGADGQIETVQYHLLPAILLNEVQRQQRENDQLGNTVKSQQAEINELREMLMSLQRQLGTQVSKAVSGQ